MFIVNGPSEIGGKKYVRMDDVHENMPVGIEALKNPSILLAESTRYEAWDLAENICELLNEKVSD